MAYQIYLPSPSLSNFIKYYWHLELGAASTHVERVIPSGEPQLIFHYKTPFCEVSAHQKVQHQPLSLICGQHTVYRDITSTEAVGVLAAVLQPYALSVFMPQPINDFTNLGVALEHIFPHENAELQDQFTQADGIRARISIVEAFLYKHIAIQPHLAVVKAAVDAVTSTQGHILIADLANHLNMSQRQLERVFKAVVGLTPKTFARIVRLQTAIQQIHNVDSLTSLSYEAGYFDQAHLIHEFRQFTGFTPKMFFQQDCL
ncbi:MAG: helix-turn-helix transcriptional regulator [Deinococcota bacterium]